MLACEFVHIYNRNYNTSDKYTACHTRISARSHLPTFTKLRSLQFVRACDESDVTARRCPPRLHVLEAHKCTIRGTKSIQQMMVENCPQEICTLSQRCTTSARYHSPSRKRQGPAIWALHSTTVTPIAAASCLFGAESGNLQAEEATGTRN